MTPSLRYIFKNPAQTESWLKELLQTGNWRQEPLIEHETTFFDTFDWRLYRQQASLELISENRRQCLSFRSFNGDLLAGHDGFCAPDFAWNLPAGQLHQKLEPLLKMRRLLPLVSVNSRLRNLLLCNNKGKVLLRLQLFSDCLATAPPGTRHKIHPHVQIMPIPKFHAAAQDVSTLFETDKRLGSTDTHPLNEAMAAIGRPPANYSSKINVQLKAAQNAGQALRTLLLHLLATLKANLEGTCADLDSEFLHDFRVAIRRTRSALSQLKGIIPPDEVAPFKADFSWLGAITGPTRDLDVYLLKFNDYKTRLPKHQHHDLDPFHRFLVQRQKTEQQTMATALASRRFHQLLASWQDLLEHKQKGVETPPTAKLPVKEVADRRVWKLYKRCLKEGNAIDTDSPAEALHELRKTCKKLRYLLEFFQSLYPPSSIKGLIQALKVLQDNLGDFQDYQVQGEAIHAFGMEMAEKHQATPATLLAMGVLAGSLFHQQRQTREEFDHRFKTFCQRKNHQLFQKLFGSTGR